MRARVTTFVTALLSYISRLFEAMAVTPRSFGLVFEPPQLTLVYQAEGKLRTLCRYAIRTPPPHRLSPRS